MWLVLTLLLGIVPLAYFYLTRNHNYWKKRGIPYIKPRVIFGNVQRLAMMKQAVGPFLGDMYNAPEGKNQKYFGIFNFNSEPALFVKDPELLKQILVKDFQHFHNRFIECDPEYDSIGYHNLFSIRDEKWKYLRTKLSPAFTSGKMKQMFKLIIEVADELLIYIDQHIKNDGNIIEIKEVAGKYTTDVISTCAFGIQSNSLNDPKALFREFGRGIFTMTFRRGLEVRALFFMHSIAKKIQACLFPKYSTNFFRDAFWNAMDTRIKQGISRNDFLDTLIQLKNESEKRKQEQSAGDKAEIFEFDGDSLLSQSVLFFAAGFETTSTTICNTLLELAFAPEIQETLRREIQDAFAANNGELPYDALFDLKYLDKVISEVLRKYPPMPFLDRQCTKDYKIPGSDLVIKKGTGVFTALYNGLHYDPEYYPDPQKFDPERFNDENKAARHPFSYLPFGEGPHICIGMRFALMNVKTSVCRLLNKYRVEPTEGLKMPLPLDHNATLLGTKGKLLLNFQPV